MHCRSCEILIEEKIREIPEVKNVNISWKSKHADVFSKQPISSELIRTKVEEAGYEVGKDEKKAWLTLEPKVYTDLTFAVVAVFVLYLIARALGIFNISFGSLSNPSSLIIVLLIGLTAGFSSCMALVGGLILGISARHSKKHPEATPSQKFRPHLFFNLGRIISYFLLGGLIGLVGKAFQLSGPLLGTLTIIVGLVMLLVGLQLTELSPKLASISLSLPAGISKIFGLKKRHEKEYSHLNSMLVGALTFFLPCGFTQAMQLYAMSTGSFWRGALIMAAFAIGTAPGLLSVGGLTSIVKGAFARRFFKFAGVVVTILAITNISNGLNLTGISAKISSISDNSKSSQTNSNNSNVSLENGVQTVRMDQVATGYEPNNFTIKKGVPVKWIITSLDPGSCAASLYSQKLNVRKFLKAGENIIEFTPQETGRIPFSCSMGMYTGYFNVIENDQPQASNPAAKTGTADNPAPVAKPEATSNDEQIIKTTYTYQDDINPSEFTVKAGVPVRFEIEAKDNGSGCMSSITVPELTEDYDELEKGKTTVLKFTPPSPGKYYITCAMGARRGVIIAN